MHLRFCLLMEVKCYKSQIRIRIELQNNTKCTVCGEVLEVWSYLQNASTPPSLIPSP